jgi:hypothetical protein
VDTAAARDMQLYTSFVVSPWETKTRPAPVEEHGTHLVDVLLAFST